ALPILPNKAAALNLSKLEGKALIAEARVQKGKQGGKFPVPQNIKPYGKNEPGPEEDDVEEDVVEDDLVEDDDLDFDDDDLWGKLTCKASSSAACGSAGAGGSSTTLAPATPQGEYQTSSGHTAGCLWRWR